MTREKSVIGIDLGASKIRIAVIKKDGELIESKVERTSTKGAKAVLCQVQSLIEYFLLKYKNISGIGIGAIGIINSHSGEVIVSTPNIEGWKGIPIKNQLQNYFDIPIKIENDVNLVTLGEYHFGQHQLRNNNLACIVLGTGAGIGIIFNGHLFKHAHELGHMVVKFDGRTCSSCGRRGCFEAYCSGKSMQNHYNELLRKNELSITDTINVPAIFDGYKINDPIAAAVVLDFIHALSGAITNVLLTFSITDFVIAGGISGSFSIFQDQVRIHSKARTMSHLGGDPWMDPAESENLACVDDLS